MRWLFVLLLLAACTSVQTDFNYHQGHEGIEIAFDRASLPEEVDEGTNLLVRLSVHNKGAWNVRYDDMLFGLNGTPFYVDVLQDPELSRLKNSINPQSPTDVDYLHGKNISWNNGEDLVLFPSVYFKMIRGPREQPTAELFANICYKYRTVLGTLTCVDTNSYTGNEQQQICTAQTATFQDQGAPVAVTLIESRPSSFRNPNDPSYVVVRPQFTLHVRNVGNGIVVTDSVASQEEFADACNFRLDATETNTVLVNATLSNVSLDCQPNPVRLINEEAYTSCTIPESEIQMLGYYPNYRAPLTVTLKYLYTDRVTEAMPIRRLPEAIRSTTLPDSENPSLVNGVARCDYCARNPSAEGCSGITKNHSCACSSQECYKLAPEGKCILGSWCPGSAYCCAR